MTWGGALCGCPAAKSESCNNIFSILSYFTCKHYALCQVPDLLCHVPEVWVQIPWGQKFVSMFLLHQRPISYSAIGYTYPVPCRWKYEMSRKRTPSRNLVALEDIDCHSIRPLMSVKGNAKENEQKRRALAYLDMQCQHLSLIQSLLWSMGVNTLAKENAKVPTVAKSCNECPHTIFSCPFNTATHSSYPRLIPRRLFTQKIKKNIKNILSFLFTSYWSLTSWTIILCNRDKNRNDYYTMCQTNIESIGHVIKVFLEIAVNYHIYVSFSFWRLTDTNVICNFFLWNKKLH